MKLKEGLRFAFGKKTYANEVPESVIAKAVDGMTEEAKDAFLSANFVIAEAKKAKPAAKG